MTPVRLGALIVEARWPSGAPVMRTPDADDPALANDDLSDNDFLFDTDTPPPILLPGIPEKPGPFPLAMADVAGLICPHAAHIRKMNPRDSGTDLGDQFDTLIRRILRRGIPFGPPLADPSADDKVERGLHFLCYQASIEDQFETLQQDWANNLGAPQQGGRDLIIGQVRGALRTMDLSPLDGGPAQTLTAPRQWVIPTGGGYFFSSFDVGALRDVLCRPGVPA